MKNKLRLLRLCIKSGNWRGVKFVLKTVARACVWPFCRTCGKFGWFGGSPCCWKCQYENLIAALAEAEATVLAAEDDEV